MSRIAKSDVAAAYDLTGDLLKMAGGNKRVARDEVKDLVKELSGHGTSELPSLAPATDMLFRFIDHRDAKPGATVTDKDIDRGVAYAKDKLMAQYDVNNNGLSQSEVDKMSRTGKLHVQLARELKKVGLL